MANEEQLAILARGVEGWNAWRKEHPKIAPDLTRADLRWTHLRRVDLRGADLRGANVSKAVLDQANLRRAKLSEANLREAYLRGAHLTGTTLRQAKLRDANLRGANLQGANLREATLGRADLSETILRGANLHAAYLEQVNLRDAKLTVANLSQAYLRRANLTGANLSGAMLCGADLQYADLSDAKLFGANLSGADLGGAILRDAILREAILSEANLGGAFLERATFLETRLEKARLTGCRIHGVSVWDITLDAETHQADLIITPEDQPTITVDNLEVAQFVYLLLNNQRIRQIINTITSKVVLILGRFTEERKAVLDALREELRRRDYLPVLFDFDKPTNRDLTETIQTLAGMARFVIADLTDAKSLPQELMAIVPGLPSVPVQPLLLAGAREYAMFEHFRRYPWVLPEYRYEQTDDLLAALADRVIAPAETKAVELRRRD